MVARSWREWEATAIPDRDYQDLLCRLFSTGPVQLGFGNDYSPQLAVLPEARTLAPIGDERSNDTADGNQQLIGRDLVMAAARDSADWIQRAEQTNVGPHTLDQFRSDIQRIVTLYPNRPVGPTFAEVLHLRNRAFELIEGRQHPDQTRDLYLITGVLCGILANASFDLGYLAEAETQARTAWLCADLADNNWLRSWTRGTQSLIAYWDDRPSDAVALARSAWDYTPESGTPQVRLAALEARAHARLRDASAAEDALRRADHAREAVTGDDEIGGMLVFPHAKQSFYAATCHLWLGGDQRFRQAERLAAAAVGWYEATPPDRRRTGEQCLAMLDLAAARLALGEIEGAAEAVQSVLSTGSRRRTDSVTRRLRQLSGQLERAAYRDAPVALSLREEIQVFTATRVAPALEARQQ
ncbi:XRE family transcriptional regulator [Planotetraspora sp. GP83]|uniref:XRE family transcriptional regulator n=1 Tax=Planotetraspora sp. GP83 TaxID=3156264 RepID=UPI0035113D50